MANLSTVKDYKEAFNIKAKTGFDDNHIVSKRDIINGTIFQSFHDGDKLTSVVSGLTLINDRVYFIYPKINNIEIDTDDFFPPCGGKQIATAYAFYSLYSVDSEGNEGIYSDERKDAVNALFRFNNELFSYDRPYIINNKGNDGEENIECIITATYYLNGTKYSGTKLITQKVNMISSWILKDDPTKCILVMPDKTHFDATGGTTTINVNREFSRVFCKKDLCGNIVEEKIEDNLIEDITDKSFITTSDKSISRVSGNILTVFRQKAGYPERETVVSARYNGASGSTVITQESGGNVSFKYALKFSDIESNIKYLDLDTSLEIDVPVEIISLESKYVDGELYDSTLCTDISCNSDSEWVECKFRKEDDKIFAVVKVKEINKSKTDDRECTISIKNNVDSSLNISIVVLQPSMSVIKDEYICNAFGAGAYDTLDDKSVYYELSHIHTYEDGSKTEERVPSSTKLKISYHSDNKDLLDIKGMFRKDNKFFIEFKNLMDRSATDVSMQIKGEFYDVLGNKLSDCNDIYITVKGKDIIDYNYELCFEGHNKHKTVMWDNDKDSILIPVISIKHKMVNGYIVGEEKIPFRIMMLDENNKEIFDNSFSLKVVNNDTVMAFPLNISEYGDKTYTIIQMESGLSIKLKLVYLKESEMKDVRLIVEMYSDVIGKDVWTDEKGFMVIDDKEIIKLSPCWLSPNMKDKKDIAFDGLIRIAKGEHKFESYNVYALNYMEKIKEDCNISEIVNVNDDTEKIIIKIKCE